jgi:hypothetical protein
MEILRLLDYLDISKYLLIQIIYYKENIVIFAGVT